jgi:hypothetical protein
MLKYKVKEAVMSNYKHGGFDEKYRITKKSGKPIDSEAKFFVLRLDKDPHALKAIETYIDFVKVDNSKLALDLTELIIRIKSDRDKKENPMGDYIDADGTVHPHIRCVMENNPKLYAGWYFMDETFDWNGPFGTIEECETMFKIYYANRLGALWTIVN